MGEDPFPPTHRRGPWDLESLSNVPRVPWGEVAELDIGLRLAHPEAETQTTTLSLSREGGCFQQPLKTLLLVLGKTSDSTLVFLFEESHEPQFLPWITPHPQHLFPKSHAPCPIP